MSLIKNGKIYSNLLNLSLISNENPFYSLTEQNNGQFYFEYQYLSGSSRHVIGYSCNKVQITVSPLGNSNELYFYPQNNISVNGNRQENINLLLSNDYSGHVGIGIDLDASYVYFIYKQNISSFSYSTNCKNFKIIVREGIGNYKDYVNIYLNDFEYDAPFKAQMWGKHIKIITCKMVKIRMSFESLFVFISIK